MSWVRKHSWVIILIVPLLAFVLQVLSYVGVQAEQWSFLSRRFLHLTIFEISIIVLGTALIAYRLAYHSIAKRSGSFSTTEIIKDIKRRATVESDYPGKVDDLISEWQRVLDSDAPIETKVRSYDTLDGYETEEFINDNGEFMILFDKTKIYTVTEIEAIARALPKIENYVKEIINTRISDDSFLDREEATEHAKKQIRRIVGTLENIKKSLLNK